MTTLAEVLDLAPLADHDGRSGAAIETGRLADGTRVYVKRSALDDDLARLVTGSGHRELDLFHAGVLHDLPAGVGTALLGVEEVDGAVVTITTALDDAILRWDRVLTPAEVRLIFRRIRAVHEHFTGRVPGGLCSLTTRISLFAPQHLDALERANAELVTAVRRGRELLPDLVPPALAESLERSLADPAPLAAAMSIDGTTLLHGDFWLVNLALDGDTLIPLDWGIATDGPAPLDLVTFCLGGMSNVDLPRDALLAEARAACPSASDDAFRLAEYWALMELGWNKAVDAVDHPEEAKRATEQADLDFWAVRGLAALDAGLVP